MKERSKTEALADIGLSLIPIAGAVYHGRKNHKQGFVEASEIYEKKFDTLMAEKRQLRRDVLGEEQVFICPQAWDSSVWQKKLDVFIAERCESNPKVRELFCDFLGFCIETFPQKRLAETLNDLKTVRNVLLCATTDLPKVDQDDIELAIDFLCFYRENPEIKKMKDDLVAVLPNTNGCNFLILGRTGVGKSSLLNKLLGVERFATGTGRPVTQQGIYEQEGELNGYKVRVFDSWGLEANKLEAWHKIIRDAQEKHDLSHKVEDWFHAVVYCVNAGGHRIEDVDRDIVRSLLADDMYVVVALTKSDQCSEADADKLRATLCASDQCEKLDPENVIEVCVGAETRNGKTEPFGIEELKRAILKNYTRTIRAQLPSRCIYLAHQELVQFEEDVGKWIDKCEWKYDENENNRPLRNKCNAFGDDFWKRRFPEIVRGELTACSRFARNLATVLHVDDFEGILPSVPPEMGFWESVGNWFSKTFSFLMPWGDSDDSLERDRLKRKLSEFCAGMREKIDGRRAAIAQKVQEVIQ